MHASTRAQISSALLRATHYITLLIATSCYPFVSIPFRATMSISFGTLISPQIQLNRILPVLTIRCQSSTSRPPESSPTTGNGHNELQIGSPIILVEAPPTLKTAGSMPSLRVNTGQVKPGDVGRIVSRKPKDVWAVRLAIGTYLIDGKHFKPLDLDE